MNKLIITLLILSLTWSVFSTEVKESDEAFKSSSKVGSWKDNTFYPIMMDMHMDMDLIGAYGNPDEDFAASMVVHHWGAIFMCEELLLHSECKKLRTICKSIIKDQLQQIHSFYQLLKKDGIDFYDPSLPVNYKFSWPGYSY